MPSQPHSRRQAAGGEARAVQTHTACLVTSWVFLIALPVAMCEALQNTLFHFEGGSCAQQRRAGKTVHGCWPAHDMAPGECKNEQSRSGKL